MEHEVKQRVKRELEFTKMLVAFTAAIFLIAFAVGIIAVLRDGQSLDALLVYAAAPFATAIGFYIWKAKNENLHKYGKGQAEIESEDNAG